jgi:hypothetical protein
VEDIKQYQTKISNRFAVLENLDDGVDIYWACEDIRRKTKASFTGSLGYYELKQHKT